MDASRLETAPAHARRRRPSAPSSQARLLWPREHGAYAQLGFPLASALVVGGAGLAAVAWAAAVIGAFLAHEPLLVLLGQRGQRTRRQHGARARAQLAVLTLGTVAAAAVAVALASPSSRLAMAAAAVLTVPLGVLIWRRQEKTGPGELLAAAAFATAAAPIVLIDGDWPVAATMVGLWTGVFTMGTLAVRGVIRSLRQTRRAMLPAAVAVVGVWSACAALAVVGALGALTASAVVPTGVLALALAARPPHPRRLRQLGFALLGTSTVAATLMIAGLLTR